MKTYEFSEIAQKQKFIASDVAIFEAMSGDETQGDKKKFISYLNKPLGEGEIDLHLVTTQSIDPTHPDFQIVYEMLYREFGAKGEIETQEVLRKRSQWNPLLPTKNYPPLQYHMVILKHPRRTLLDCTDVVISTDEQEIIGVRDHNIIFSDNMIIVHLSHSLLAEYARGKGLDTVLRAIPVLDAQAFAESIRQSNAPIILYAEQEPVPTDSEIQSAELRYQVDGNTEEKDNINMRLRRLQAYQSGLFQKIGINKVCAQPDFSTSDEITAKGGPVMVELNGIWRFVGHECELQTTGHILRTAVSAIYDMYEASGLDERAVKQAKESLLSYPSDNVVIPLLKPLDTIP